MGRITAYRCDICKAIVEKPEYNIAMYPECNFELKKFRIYNSDNVACSEDCARAAVTAWIAEGKKPPIDEEESPATMDTTEKTIVFVGGQPN